MKHLLMGLLASMLIVGCTRSAEDRWPTGELKGQGPTKLGEKHGDWTLFSIPGEVRARGRYERGQETGVWTFYRKDGTVEYTEEYDKAARHVVAGRRWITRYAPDGKQPIGLADGAYSMVFNHQQGDSWTVIDGDAEFSKGRPTETGVVSRTGDIPVFQSKDGKVVNLPPDWREWAKLIRQVVPVDPILREKR